MMGLVPARALCAGLAVYAALCCQAALAGDTTQPSGDWNGSWGFSSAADRQLRLMQSDLIAKREKGYYDSFGTNVTVNNVYDYSQGKVDITGSGSAQIDVTNHTGSEIGQNTNVVGAIDASQTTIDVSGDGNSVNTQNQTSSSGCQNGSVNIDSTGVPGIPSSCN